VTADNHNIDTNAQYDYIHVSDVLISTRVNIDITSLTSHISNRDSLHCHHTLYY